MPAPHALVLFDIDGTLIRRSGPHHRQALSEAVRRELHVETTTDGIPVQGMLDRDILTIMLRSAGVPPGEIRRAMPLIIRRAESLYSRSCPDLSDKLCPGVRRVLYNVHRGKIPMGLVTGNLSRIGWMKMKRAGIAHYFRVGAFAEMASTRAGLARIAIRLAKTEGLVGKGTVISLVGDHPNDIEAARRNGIRSIAVATGLVPAEELAASSPDLVLRDLLAFRVDMLR